MVLDRECGYMEKERVLNGKNEKSVPYTIKQVKSETGLKFATKNNKVTSQNIT